MMQPKNSLPHTELQERLARYELIVHINTALAEASDEGAILDALETFCQRFGVTTWALAFTELNDAGQLYGIDFVAIRRTDGVTLNRTDIQNMDNLPLFDIERLPIIRVIAANPNEIITVENTSVDPRTQTEQARAYLKQFPIAALIMVPLKTSSGWQGILLFAWNTPQQFDLDLLLILTALQPTIAAATAMRRLFENLETIVEKRTHALQSAGEVIRQNERLFQSLLDVLPQCIFRSDVEHRYTFVNENFLNTLGLPESEVLGRPISEFYPKELADKYVADNEWAMRTGRIFEATEEHVIHATGEHIYVQVLKIPLYDGDGHAQGIQCVFWDITTVKRSEDQMRRQREFLRLVIDLNPSFVFAKDAQGRFTLANKAFADYYGMTPEELVGKIEQEISFNPVDAAAFLEADRQVIATRETVTIPEQRVTSMSGEERWQHTTKIPIFDADGAVVQVLGVATDITERKRAEAEREDLLQREQQAKQEALEAVRLKDMFLATMSHELRTPLNATIGFQHLVLMSGKLDDDNAHMLERSLANSQRLMSLINNVLDISRMASGGMKLVAAKFSPQQMARNLYEDLKLSAKDKNLTFRIEVEPDVPESIVHDEERLTQIALNLLSNAIKFTDKGFVSMTVKRKDDRLIIKVVDTGMGIAPSRQHVIFDDFVQLDSTTTRKHQGAGLGLSIVKRLLLMMKGTVKVSSEVGKGTIFTVDVPLELPLD